MKVVLALQWLASQWGHRAKSHNFWLDGAIDLRCVWTAFCKIFSGTHFTIFDALEYALKYAKYGLVLPNMHFAKRDLQIWRISPPPLPSNSVKWYLTISHSDYWGTSVLGAAYDHFCFLQMLLCQNPVTISNWPIIFYAGALTCTE